MVFGPQGPSNPTVTAVSRTEAIVSWEPPDHFLRAHLKRYEVYSNTSTKPVYSGTQTFCHLRGLQADCQYHFKILMVPKHETDETALNSKRGTFGARKGRHHGEKFQSPSYTHKKRRQAPDESHVNGKASRHRSCRDFDTLQIHPQTDRRDHVELIASGHSIYRAVQTEKSTSLPSLRLEGGDRDSQRCLAIADNVRRFPTKGISLMRSEFQPHEDVFLF